MISVRTDKDFQYPSVFTAISETKKVEPYCSDELRSIWQHHDHDWLVYCKKNLEVSF